MTPPNWIRRERRLALYLRDEGRCVYCGEGSVGAILASGKSWAWPQDWGPVPAVRFSPWLTLDHITARRRGGDNSDGNLVTACHRCNSTRRGDSLEALASRIGKPVEELERAVYLATRRRTARHLRCAKRLFSALDAYLWVKRGDAPSAEIDALLRYFLVGREPSQSEVDAEYMDGW